MNNYMKVIKYFPMITASNYVELQAKKVFKSSEEQLQINFIYGIVDSVMDAGTVGTHVFS